MARKWYPVIDYDKCIRDLVCANFCPHGVYAIDDNKSLVVNPDGCIEFCRGCQKICPADAISYFGDKEVK